MDKSQPLFQSIAKFLTHKSSTQMQYTETVHILGIFDILFSIHYNLGCINPNLACYLG